ncbi:hypothetical protein HS125_15300 [bacterium]|nr:hypothetical protein [bacterium]
MKQANLDQWCRELLLLRRGQRLSQEEREILELLMKSRPELQRLAEELERLSVLEGMAGRAEPPAGLHARLSARFQRSATAAGFSPRGSLPWLAALVGVGALGYAAAWLWLPSLSVASWLQAALDAFEPRLTSDGPPFSLDVPIALQLTLRTAFYAAVAAVALAGALLGTDRERTRPLKSEIPRERK